MTRPPLASRAGPALAPPIMFVLGTRPEAVKLAPLVIELARRQALQPRQVPSPLLVATGQHREMLDEALAGFGLEPDHDCHVMVPGQTPDQVLGRLLPMLTRLMRDIRPGRVVVQGDTSSTLAGALAARYAGVPLAHVEAGLRTGCHDPHPEEMHRKLVAQMADLHFAPTPSAATALALEGVVQGVHITGNSGIDALQMMRARLASDPALAAAAAAPLAAIPRHRPWLLATIHRRENQGEPLAHVLDALAELAGAVEVVMPVHPSPAVAGPVRARLEGLPHVHLLPALPYAGFVALMMRATLVLTDSGGVQEEAPALGLPCLVLRAVTERREGLSSGNALLVGTDAAAIMAAVRQLLGDGERLARMAEPALPYGLAGAAARITDLLLDAAEPPIVPSWPQSRGSWSQSGVHRQ